MGNCSCDSQRREAATINAIIDTLLRIRLVCEQHQLRGQRSVLAQEDLLAQTFTQEKWKRSRMTEKAMIGRTVFAKNILIIYRYIEDEARKLLERRGLFEMQENYSDLIPSINVLTYCAIFLAEDTLSKFRTLIQERFTEYRLPMDSEIPYGLIVHHRYTEQVTFEMQNAFVLQFCSERGVPVAKVNEVGHNYRYGGGTGQYDQ